MRRRRLLRSLLAVGGVGSLAGCNGLFAPTSPADTSSTSPATTASAPGTTTPASTTPYRAAGEPVLDRPRGITLRNLSSTDRFLTVVVSDGDDEVFADSTTVPARESVAFADLVGSTGRYAVLVEAADGARRRYEWTVRADLAGLWVDLTPDIDFRRPVLCFDDAPFAVADDQRTVAYDLPADVDVGDALGRTPAVALDNDAPDSTRVVVRVWNGGQRWLATTYDLPPDVRALVPVVPASQRYVIILRTDAGEAIYDWQPSVRNTLYATLADGPTFRCGYADHDLQIRNETDADRAVTVRVFADGATLYEESVAVEANAVRTVPSAVDPVGPFRFEIETDAGRREQYNWVRCAPNGPITVAVREAGISVSVRPAQSS